MRKQLDQKGFSIVEVLIALVILVAIAASGWLAWHHTHSKKSSATTVSTKSSAAGSGQPSHGGAQNHDFTESGKYLYIKEWDVRVALPAAFQGKASYSIADATDPESGLPLQSATIYVATQALSPNECAVTTTSVGPSVQVGALYIRSETSKTFDAARYKPTFKENILVAKGYAYHLDYATPDCMGGDNDNAITSLQAALTALSLAN